MTGPSEPTDELVEQLARALWRTAPDVPDGGPGWSADHGHTAAALWRRDARLALNAIEDAGLRLVPVGQPDQVPTTEPPHIELLSPDRRAEAILTAHQRRDISSCLCGWSELGRSHPEHQVAMLRNAAEADQ
jgi:hypothetical protein